MTRTRKSARQAGARFERQVADYLNQHVDDRIDRRVKTGRADKGDISGLRHMGQRLVVEVKDYGGQLKPGTWMAEAHTEAGNDDAQVALVVAKRRGTAKPEDQWVLTTLGDLVALLTGETEHRNG